jgi:beta-glucosidase
MAPRRRSSAGGTSRCWHRLNSAPSRDAVRRSCAAQNNGGLLPLAANKHVLVTGDGADNISKQNGG